MKINYLHLKMSDYPQVIQLWQQAPGIGLSSADEPKAIEAYLARNPGISSTAWDGGRLVGAVLCGHDGRRGYIHHLAVAPSHYKLGIGRKLVERCLDNLAKQGIEKCHIFVYQDNQEAMDFWAQIGWVRRDELIIMSSDIPVD